MRSVNNIFIIEIITDGAEMIIAYVMVFRNNLTNWKIFRQGFPYKRSA